MEKSTQKPKEEKTALKKEIEDLEVRKAALQLEVEKLVRNTSVKGTRRITEADKAEIRKTSSRLVKGTFRAHGDSSKEIRFYFTLPWERPESYTLKDGEEYELPLGVVRHINNSCRIEEPRYAIDEYGRPLIENHVNQKFSFEIRELTKASA